MSALRKFPWPCAGALAFALVAAGCAQREVSRIPAGPAFPGDRPLHETAEVPSGEPVEAPGPFLLSPPTSQIAPLEPETRAALDSRILVPLELTYAEVDEAPVLVPEGEPPLDPPSDPLPAPLPDSENRPLVADATPAPPRVDLRGLVLSSTSGPLPPSTTPLIVFALPVDGAQDQQPTGRVPLEPPASAAIARRIEGKFFPEFVVTSPGRGVCFENQDEICHNFFSSSGPNAFDLGMLKPGETRTVDLQHPGRVQVYCSLHTGKQLSVFVAPSPLHAQVGADGTFVLEGIEPGAYELTAWEDGPRSRTLPVKVDGGSMQPLLIHLDPEPEDGVE